MNSTGGGASPGCPGDARPSVESTHDSGPDLEDQ